MDQTITVKTNSITSEFETRAGSILLDNLGWLPLMAIITSYIMRASSTAPISSMLQNELYPTEIRGKSKFDNSNTLLAERFQCFSVVMNLKKNNNNNLVLAK